MTAETKFEPSNVNVRIKIAGLWTSYLFISAYVGLFSLYRPDFRADIEAGAVGAFTLNQAFLLGATIYVVIPSLSVFGTGLATTSEPNRQHRAGCHLSAPHHR